jgi:hypothetical protein
MSGLGTALRNASAVAERAAVTGQYAGLSGARSDAAIVGGFQHVADALNHAAGRVDPWPFPSRRAIVRAAFSTGCWIVSCAVVLLLIPDPARPWVLALAVAGSGVLAMLLGVAAAAIGDRRAARTLASAGVVTDVHDAVTDLRTRISAIVATLDPTLSDEHEVVGRQTEAALVWLDGIEIDAAPRTPPATREYRYRFGPS